MQQYIYVFYSFIIIYYVLLLLLLLFCYVVLTAKTAHVSHGVYDPGTHSVEKV